MSSGAAHRLPTQRAQALADIEDVGTQLEAGELDQPTADRLIARYRLELETLDSTHVEPVAPSATSSRRMVGAAVLIVAFVGVSVVAFGAIRPRDEGRITPGSSGFDLDEVTNDQMEAVIAANPDLPEVAAMRIALADRYFDEAAFSDALPHYLTALEGPLDQGRQARALARIGWMSFVSGRADLAEVYLQEALETDSSYEESHLFLGFVRFSAGDSVGALAELEPLLASEDVPEDLREELQATVDAARAGLEAGPAP